MRCRSTRCLAIVAAGSSARSIARTRLISPSVLTDTLKPYTNDEFQLAIESLRVFARERTTFVNAEVAASRVP